MTDIINSRICKIDGEKGELSIMGFPIKEISDNSSFEEAVYLLLYGDLPRQNVLDEFKSKLISFRKLDPVILDVLKFAADKKIGPTEATRIGVSCLSMDSSIISGGNRDPDVSLKIIALQPSIVASYWRLLNGKDVIHPHASLGFAANYMYMLTGNKPLPEHERALEIYLTTVIEHGLNASTLAARVVTSTRSDFVSAIAAAIGALKGELHGGAPGPALEMLIDIKGAPSIENYLRDKLDRGERLMGFGHRIYRVTDPRAELLSKIATVIWQKRDDKEFWNIAKDVENIALRLLKEKKPHRSLQTNVEYYTALLLYGIGIHPDLFTATFSISRVVGWLAHCAEQLKADHIIRPVSAYCGDDKREWIPINDR